MNDNERIINNLDDAIVSMGVSRTSLELVRRNMIDGIKNPGARIVSFDIDVLDATILSMMANEQMMRTLLVEYKARRN